MTPLRPADRDVAFLFSPFSSALFFSFVFVLETATLDGALVHGTHPNGFLLGLTGFDWVLPRFTGFYWVLLSFPGFSWVLLGFTAFHQF